MDDTILAKSGVSTFSSTIKVYSIKSVGLIFGTRTAHINLKHYRSRLKPHPIQQSTQLARRRMSTLFIIHHLLFFSQPRFVICLHLFFSPSTYQKAPSINISITGPTHPSEVAARRGKRSVRKRKKSHRVRTSPRTPRRGYTTSGFFFSMVEWKGKVQGTIHRHTHTAAVHIVAASFVPISRYSDFVRRCSDHGQQFSWG